MNNNAVLKETVAKLNFLHLSRYSVGKIELTKNINIFSKAAILFLIFLIKNKPLKVLKINLDKALNRALNLEVREKKSIVESTKNFMEIYLEFLERLKKKMIEAYNQMLFLCSRLLKFYIKYLKKLLEYLKWLYLNGYKNLWLVFLNFINQMLNNIFNYIMDTHHVFEHEIDDILQLDASINKFNLFILSEYLFSIRLNKIEAFSNFTINCIVLLFSSTILSSSIKSINGAIKELKNCILKLKFDINVIKKAIKVLLFEFLQIIKIICVVTLIKHVTSPLIISIIKAFYYGRKFNLKEQSMFKYLYYSIFNLTSIRIHYLLNLEAIFRKIQPCRYTLMTSYDDAYAAHVSKLAKFLRYFASALVPTKYFNALSSIKNFLRISQIKREMYIAWRIHLINLKYTKDFEKTAEIYNNYLVDAMKSIDNLYLLEYWKLYDSKNYTK